MQRDECPYRNGIPAFRSTRCRQAIEQEANLVSNSFAQPKPNTRLRRQAPFQGQRILQEQVGHLLSEPDHFPVGQRSVDHVVVEPAHRGNREEEESQKEHAPHAKLGGAVKQAPKSIGSGRRRASRNPA